MTISEELEAMILLDLNDSNIFFKYIDWSDRPVEEPEGIEIEFLEVEEIDIEDC